MACLPACWRLLVTFGKIDVFGYELLWGGLFACGLVLFGIQLRVQCNRFYLGKYLLRETT